MKDLEINFKYVSAKSYSDITGLNYGSTLEMCEKGELEAIRADGGQWRIKVYKGDCISREEYEKIATENIRLKAIIDGIFKLAASEAAQEGGL